MKYRIVKRSYTDGTSYYVIQSKSWIFPWSDLEGYSSNDYFFLDIDSARARIEELKVKRLKDVIVE